MLLAPSADRLTRLSALPVDGLAETLPPRVSSSDAKEGGNCKDSSWELVDGSVFEGVGEWVCGVCYLLFTFIVVLIIFSPF